MTRLPPSVWPFTPGTRQMEDQGNGICDPLRQLCTGSGQQFCCFFTNKVASRQKWLWAMLLLIFAIFHVWVDFVLSVVLIEHVDIEFLAVVCIFPLASYISPFIGLACLVVNSPELGRYFVAFNVLSITNAMVALVITFSLDEPDLLAVTMAALLISIKMALNWAMNHYVAHLEWVKDWKLSHMQPMTAGFSSMIFSNHDLGNVMGRNPLQEADKRYQSFQGAFRSISR